MPDFHGEGEVPKPRTTTHNQFVNSVLDVVQSRQTPSIKAVPSASPATKAKDIRVRQDGKAWGYPRGTDGKGVMPRGKTRTASAQLDKHVMYAGKPSVRERIATKLRKRADKLKKGGLIQ